MQGKGSRAVSVLSAPIKINSFCYGGYTSKALAVLRRILQDEERHVTILAPALRRQQLQVFLFFLGWLAGMMLSDSMCWV